MRISSESADCDPGVAVDFADTDAGGAAVAAGMAYILKEWVHRDAPCPLASSCTLRGGRRGRIGSSRPGTAAKGRDSAAIDQTICGATRTTIQYCRSNIVRPTHRSLDPPDASPSSQLLFR